jgi:hypothetical protein
VGDDGGNGGSQPPGCHHFYAGISQFRPRHFCLQEVEEERNCYWRVTPASDVISEPPSQEQPASRPVYGKKLSYHHVEHCPSERYEGKVKPAASSEHRTLAHARGLVRTLPFLITMIPNRSPSWSYICPLRQGMKVSLHPSFLD